MNSFHEKLVEIVRIVAKHYDVGFRPECKDIWSAHDKTKQAEYIYNKQLTGMDLKTRNIINNLLAAHSKEEEEKITYAYLAGLKHGIFFCEWLKSEDLPCYLEKVEGIEDDSFIAQKNILKNE